MVPTKNGSNKTACAISTLCGFLESLGSTPRPSTSKPKVWKAAGKAMLNGLYPKVKAKAKAKAKAKSAAAAAPKPAEGASASPPAPAPEADGAKGGE